jgi:hypothetical protein
LDAHVRPSFRGIDGSERTGRLDRVDKLRAPTAPVLGHGVQDGSRSRAGWDIAGVKAHGHAARGDAGLATGATALWSLGRGPLARGANAPRVVVVGAGLVGLTCAYRLQQARVDATVYEAAGRVGGRCWTIYDAFAEGQIAEHGGELIDQGHNRIRNLVQELGLDLENLLKAEANGTEATYFFDGGLYTYAEATDDLKAAWQKIHKDVSAASYPTLFDLSTERGRQLDAMSIVEWIDETFDGGVDSKIGRLLDIAPTRSSTAARPPSRARSTSSTCWRTRARASSACSGARTRSTTCAGATTRCRSGSPRNSKAGSRRVPSSWRWC